MFSSIRAPVLLVLLSLTVPSFAFASLERQVCVGQYCDCLLIDGRAQCELLIHPGEPSFVQLPAAITDVDTDRQGRFKLGVTGDTVAIKALPKVAPTDELALQLRAGPHVYASVTVRIAEPQQVANRLVLVTPTSELKAAMEASAQAGAALRENQVRSIYEPQLDGMKRKLDSVLRDHDEQLLAAERQRAQSHLDQPAHKLVPHRPPSAFCERDQICADIVEALPDRDDLHVKWTIRNRQALPLHIAAIHQSKPVARPLYAVAAKAPPRKENVITTVAPGQTVEGNVILYNVTNEDLRALSLTFITDTGRSFSAAGIVFYPTPKEELEARGRISVVGLALAGFVWLPNPADKEDLDATTMLGGGARVEYGFNSNLSVWGEGAGARSGSAEFGAVTRQATIGRASVGGLLKIGYETITTMRLGIGGMGMRIDTAGEDSSWQFEGIVNFGGGVDRRLGDSLVVGASLLVGLPWGESQFRELEAGIHLAYSWQPNAQPAP